MHGRGRAQRGRIDLLVYADPSASPLALIESKRSIRGDQELQQAVRQAFGYAQALDLATFLVAAPQGLWGYRRDGPRTRIIRYVTSLGLHQRPERILPLLRSPVW